MAAPQVDLVVNCWERSYREVLEPGYIAALAADSRFPYAGRTVLINNVDDPADADRRAQALLETGEVTAVHRVADRLDEALRITGVRWEDIARAPHYTNCALVGITVPGAPWLAYWDADVRLETPVDWITPSVELMDRDRRLLVANPNAYWHPEPGLGHVEHVDGFSLGRGFSDQLFLARRADLARPIYGDWHPAAWRYPMSHLTRVFEARVDSHMRRHGLLRASHLRSSYLHPKETAGGSYPGQTPREQARERLMQVGVAALRKTPARLRPPTLRDL